jgi:hypothetical protein
LTQTYYFQIVLTTFVDVSVVVVALCFIKGQSPMPSVYNIYLVIERVSKHEVILFVQMNQIAECLIFFLFCITVKHQTRSLLSQYETPEKETNERTTEYDISIAFFSFSLPPQ